MAKQGMMREAFETTGATKGSGKTVDRHQRQVLQR